MSRLRAPRRLAALAAATQLTAAVLLFSAAPASAAEDRLRIDFGQGASLAAGTSVADVSGNGNHGVVRVAFNGRIKPTNGFADFPDPCRKEPCPNAMIEVADSGSLDPGTAPFEWGARIRLASGETADGENVLQKGRWGEAGGQWKLQVDKAAGKPSCVVSGIANGSDHRVVVTSSIGIANNTWRSVVCRRTANRVEVLVDGVVRGSASMPAVDLSSSAPVTIGAKDVSSRDNDQFLGRLDDVFMRLL